MLRDVTARKETAVLDTLPQADGQLQTIPDSGAVLAAAAPQPPDPAHVAAVIARYEAYRALREFRARLYGCLAARADALFELCDAILCAGHAATPGSPSRPDKGQSCPETVTQRTAGITRYGRPIQLPPAMRRGVAPVANTTQS
jgi:hypothetical protein